MAKSWHIKGKMQGVRAAALKSDGVAQACLASAQKIASTASSIDGCDYGCRMGTRGKRRVYAFVYPADLHAVRANAKYDTLQRSL